MKAKSYAIEEAYAHCGRGHAAVDWIERVPGFSSLKKARSYLRRMDNAYHGRLRVVRVLRQPVKESK